MPTSFFIIQPLLECRASSKQDAFGPRMLPSSTIAESYDTVLKCARRPCRPWPRRKKYANWHERLVWMTSLVEKVEMPSTYVVCFCERSDLLSQWRGYSGGEQGVTLGFDATKLQERFSGRARLAKVIYGATKTKQALRTVIRAFCKEVGKGPASEDVKEEFVRFIHRCIPRFKHYGFREEREWRLVVQTSEASHLKFRPKRTRLVPYFELSSNEKKRLPIKSMRVGPGSDIDLTAESLKILMAKHDYQNAKIWRSKIPYRPE